MAKLSIRDLNVRGKRVLVRVDYNVPLEERDGNMVITDITRMKETLGTLEWLSEQGARAILVSHLGRPEGRREPTMSLRPVAAKLADLVGRPVAFVDDCIGEKVEKTVSLLQPGDILLLENVRFYPEEEKNDRAFAEKLAAVADLYVNDAFGSAHRAHASTEGVPRVIAARGGPCAAGFLMERELKFLGDELEKPERPFIVILGGAKVSDKIQVINRLTEKADAILIGGAMAYTFNLAQGFHVGRSKAYPEDVQVAKNALAKARARAVRFLLPTDHVVATPVATGKKDKQGKAVVEFQNPRVVNDVNVPDDAAGLDIGPATARNYAAEVAAAKTLLWNGPMGMFEDKRFAEGTQALGRAVADATKGRGLKSIIGGGDSVKALHQAGLGDRVTFMSTGGGASLEFLEGKVLPGVAALTDQSIVKH